ncbi:DUF4124 domain-containing protein [Silvimonas iriomotensis]|uniref:DUF4124 domain-containing protein n=1 Tax=Silvimonas iriomotensis TaxID=449662 RepID=A0ABQ2PBK7_9NEIS|nr:DUF4124 domain-containing protein [Silvimonas iriomotensis]GGP22924.1 hypothetical protein GCM10010970_29240 [Silvimonas iriomotensis]
MKYSGLPVALAFLLVAVSAQAQLYRWVDDNGQVQYSDKPPVTGPKKGVSELDSQGIVRKAPVQPLTPEEKAKQDADRAQALDRERRDKALLQSFSNTHEIDVLRDRQIESVQAGIQTNNLRRQGAEARLDRLNRQIDSFKKRKKDPPADLFGDVAGAQKEIADINADTQSKQVAIQAIRQRAEDDKKRLTELMGH